jgi:hypothetical protein
MPRDFQPTRSSLFNNTHAFAKFQLHLVYGSLGLGMQKNPFFEFGGKDWNTIDDFMTSPVSTKDSMGRTSIDAHVWLEDDSGKIYDICTDYMRKVCKFRGLKIRSNISIIAGVEKSILEQSGIWHVAASPSVQQQLAELFHTNWYDTYELHIVNFYKRTHDIHTAII